MTRLVRQLESLRPELAEAAQGVLDQWEQDEEGWDEEFGAGGACDAVAAAMAGVLDRAGVDSMEGGHDGDDHAYLIAYDDRDACAVDIPPGVYEVGGGYNWRKRAGVVLSEDDVELSVVRRADIDPNFTPNARAKNDDPVVTRFLGICPVCEGRYKLEHRGPATAMSDKFRMVHHGYKRPGSGSIEGDCRGVHYPPYEVSTEGCEVYLGSIEASLERNRIALHRLQSGEIQELHRLENRYARHEEPRFRVLTPADGAAWRIELADRIRRTEYQVRDLEREQARMQGLINNWQRRPVMTLEEDTAQKRAKSEAAKALRDEARAVRVAKRSALDQKNAEREAEKQALVREYAETFLHLAQSPSIVSRRAARDHWAKMRKRQSKKRYLRFYPEEMHVDEALTALELARPSRYRGEGRYDYASDYGVLLG